MFYNNNFMEKVKTNKETGNPILHSKNKWTAPYRLCIQLCNANFGAFGLVESVS